MITVTEIKRKSLNLYKEVLAAAVAQTSFFPKTLAVNKSLSKDFMQMSTELEPLISASKSRKTYGYSIRYRQVKTRLHGLQDIPDSIVFETLDDYLIFIQKKAEYTQFTNDVNLIIKEFPSLADWCQKNVLGIIANANQWPEILTVCKWFKDSHEVNKFYAREIPVNVSTKFIESHVGILNSLLEIIVPHLLKEHEQIFERRFGLKYAAPLIRLRLLDQQQAFDGKFKDVSIPVNDLVASGIDCENVIITENKMNFLMLPNVTDTIAIWGGGFAVSNLQEIQWLSNKKIFYWGDIDVQGLEILSQLRSFYPQTRTIMMDSLTLEKFRTYHTKGSKSKCAVPSSLTEDEIALYNYIKDHDIRLEQERIPQAYILEALATGLKKR